MDRPDLPELARNITWEVEDAEPVLVIQIVSRGAGDYSEHVDGNTRLKSERTSASIRLEHEERRICRTPRTLESGQTCVKFSRGRSEARSLAIIKNDDVSTTLTGKIFVRVVGRVSGERRHGHAHYLKGPYLLHFVSIFFIIPRTRYEGCMI